MIFEGLQDDVRLAWRGMRRAKGFSAAAILTLAMGIAGSTVMLALVQGVLLRQLPVRDQDEILIAWKELKASGYAHYPFGDNEIKDVERASRLLQTVAGVTANGFSPWVVIDEAGSGYVKGALVTGRFFDVLGIEPVLGRTLEASDDVDGAENVVVIGSGLWRRRYGSSPGIIGRRITLDEQPCTIVGVMPPDVDYPRQVELWRTTRSVPISGAFGDAARQEVDLIARRRPDVTLEQAAGELGILTRQFEARDPKAPRGLTPVVRPFAEMVVGNVGAVMIAFVVAVGIVLLIASANVANLLLLRGEARRPEFAVREALGAGRRRIVRQLMMESVVLTVAAAGVGLVVAWWSLQSLVTLIPDGLPRLESIRIDAVVVMLTVAVAFVTSLLAGVVPAMLATRVDIASQLRSGSRGVTGAAARQGRRALVVTQVALAVTVVAAAGLLVRTVLRLQSVDTGFAADRLVFVDLTLPQLKYSEQTRHGLFLDGLIESLENAPGIAAATPVNVSPFSGGWDSPRFTAEGQSADRAATNPSLNLEAVHANHFGTLGIPIVRGRAFTRSDRKGALDVAIVSDDVAAQTWPGQDPIGKRLKMGGQASDDPWRTVVGIAAPVRYRDLKAPRATLYLPAAQFIVAAQTIAIRTTASVATVAAVAREKVRSLDDDVQVMRVTPFASTLDAPLARPRFNALLLAIFAAAALLLATVGHYSVLAAYVRQREREIALRVALGATPARVRALVFGEAMWLAGLGALIGLSVAAAATRLLRQLLFEIGPLDPASLGGAAAVLILASLFASYLPIRRATRLDPASMLRV